MHGVDIDVAGGRVTAVVGPNGAGKSTLLKAILGIARVMDGQILLDGQDVTGRGLEQLARRGVGYVPQVDDVFDSMRVSENLAMGGYLLDKRTRAERFEQVLDIFPDLRGKLRRYVGSMSGGERKMTALARALMLEPSVLILDEPTAGLSPALTSTEASLLEALRGRTDLRYVLGLHEGPVVSMADGYARVTGKPGVACLHTTVGTLNGASQIYNAFQDSSPVVVTAGHKDTTVLSESGFCSHPHLPEAVRPFTKWAHQTLSAGELGSDLWRALHAAMTAPAGPAYLALPEDMLRGTVPADAPVPPVGNAAMWGIVATVPDEASCAAAAAALAAARWPVLVAGSQARGCVAELRALADTLAAPLLCTDFSDLAELPFPTADHRYLGLYGEDPAVLEGCDLVVAVGARIFYPFSAGRHPRLPPGARLVHIHPDPGQVGRLVPTEIGITATPAAALRALHAQLLRTAGADGAGAEQAERAGLAGLRAARDAARSAEQGSAGQGSTGQGSTGPGAGNGTTPGRCRWTGWAPSSTASCRPTRSSSMRGCGRPPGCCAS